MESCTWNLYTFVNQWYSNKFNKRGESRSITWINKLYFGTSGLPMLWTAPAVREDQKVPACLSHRPLLVPCPPDHSPPTLLLFPPPQMVSCPPAHVHISTPSAVPPAASLFPLPVGQPTCWLLTVPSVLSSPTRSWPGSFSGLTHLPCSLAVILPGWAPLGSNFHPWTLSWLVPTPVSTPATAFTVSPDTGIWCSSEDPVTCFRLELPSQLFAPSAYKPWLCSQWNFLPIVTVYNLLRQGCGSHPNSKPCDI